MTTYSQQQIALCFAYLAYTDELLTTGTPTLDAQIASDLTAALSATASTPIPPIAGNWSLAWGPVSYTVPGALYQDNMMYVVQPTASSGLAQQYCVAVRGTNGASGLDWLIEDFDILQQMPWPPGATGSSVVGNISESASIGLTVLLNMQDPTTGDTLQEFLSAQMSALSSSTASGSVPITFVGHSLGAMLASTLALYMLENQSSWDPNTYSAVSTITFAGPTAGNADFASYLDSTFPSGAAQFHAGQYDIIPLLWNTTSMATISSLYVKAPIIPFLVTYAVQALVDFLKGTTLGYTQSANLQTLATPLIPPANLPPLPGASSSQFSSGGDYEFLQEASYQHHYSYPCFYGVPSLLTAIVNAYAFSSSSACASTS